jgi:CubicO group peptidase (beta-lactamase class C family)
MDNRQSLIVENYLDINLYSPFTIHHSLLTNIHIALINTWPSCSFHQLFLPCMKQFLLKTTLYSFLLAVLCYGCDAFSGEKKKTEDSLRYYPATPPVLNQKEFRYYFRLVNDFFDSTLLKTGFNGGILVAKDGAVIYEKYVGRVDLRKEEPMTDSTAMHIASTGKTFTAIAILQMVQEKKLSLEDSISTFFPGLPYPGITVKMLLNHRSGLPNYIYFVANGDWDKTKYVTNADVLNLLYTQKPKRTYPPGTHFSYCNTNFVLLAMIIEKISGQSFPEYMRQKLFEPLQMKHTYVFTMADSAKATPSFEWNGRFWKYDFLEGTYGDKNIYSTPRDLLKWDQALYTEQVVSKALLDSAFTPYSFENRSVHNYGLGWHLLLLPNGKKVIYHFGRWHGFNSAFARLTDEKATIIILGNRYNRAIYNTAHQAYDLFGDYLQHRGNKDEEETDNPEPSKKHSSAGSKMKKSAGHSKAKSKRRH